MSDLFLCGRRVVRGWRWRSAVIAAGALMTLGAAQPSRAATITVGNRTLLPNTADQKIQIFVTGNESIAGEDFYAQIGDGGTYNGGVNTKPVFQSVDVLTGTIFGSNNTGSGAPANNPTHPLIWVDGTSTGSGTVQASGLLATLTVDTSGVASGTFPLLLSGVASKFGGFTTDLTALVNSTVTPIPLTINNGSITVAAPEPTSLGALAVTGLLVLRRSRGRSRR